MVQFTWRFVFGICTYIWYTYFFNSESGEQNRKALQAWWDNLTMDAVIGYADVAWESLAGLFWKLWEQGFEGLLEWGDERLIKICFAALAFKAPASFSGSGWSGTKRGRRRARRRRRSRRRARKRSYRILFQLKPRRATILFACTRPHTALTRHTYIRSPRHSPNVRSPLSLLPPLLA